ncbi:MAG TPA: hypothetical protein VMZ92_06385 [Planctomycetota bacterium]|nr:hypothetical protein [Planctomycetota bacterium]
MKRKPFINVQNQDRGAVLIAALILAVIVAVFCVTGLLVSNMESQGTHAAIQRDKAFFVASAGLHDEIKTLKEIMAVTLLRRPFFDAFEALAGQHTIERRPLISDGITVGEYDVVIGSVQPVDAWHRDISITATGHVPSADDPRVVTRTITAIVRVGIEGSDVFDYVYLIDNWGWHHGDRFIANGNVRANGQFDFGGYATQIDGIPRFEKLPDGTLGEMIDEGGVYASWNIIGTDSLVGETSRERHLHEFFPPEPMPDLAHLGEYELLAKADNSTIKIDGEIMANAVVGDEIGENPNLYLKGTLEHPIEMNGTVVVRGNVIIKGYIKGQGAIYSAGNIYVSGNVQYVDPLLPIPFPRTKTAVVQWIEHNAARDLLGLFAVEQIVVGDFNDASWRDDIGQWISDPRNMSEEDAGEDRMPNTRPGRDGILGTADDDVLENDDVWTVERYTEMHAEHGWIPKGFQVGDPIPGTGEDLDDDGQYDPGTQLSDFDLNVPLKKEYWEGNFPETAPTSYAELCSNDYGRKINRLDAVFYTNHTFAMHQSGKELIVEINGALAARNEAIIYEGKRLIMTHDLRLLQEELLPHIVLPKTWKPVKMVMWRSN